MEAQIRIFKAYNKLTEFQKDLVEEIIVTIANSPGQHVFSALQTALNFHGGNGGIKNNWMLYKALRNYNSTRELTKVNDRHLANLGSSPGAQEHHHFHGS